MKKLSNTNDAAARNSFIHEFTFGDKAKAMEALIIRAQSAHLPYDDDDSAIYAELEKTGDVCTSDMDEIFCISASC